jgi:hypothetical protein
MSCKEYLADCFAGYNFAGDPISRLNAIEYLRCCVENHVTWVEVEKDIREYLRHMKANDAEIQRQLGRANSRLAVWL